MGGIRKNKNTKVKDKNIKQLLLSIAISLAFTIVYCSCENNNTPEKKAQALIKQSLEKTMNDFSSYEPVDFGTLDSTFTSV